MIIVVLLMMLITLFFSKLLFRSYLSLLGFFGIVWGVSLSLLCLITLGEFPLQMETWLVILSFWAIFFLGSITVGFASYPYAPKTNLSNTELKLSFNYKKILIILGILALVGSICFTVIIISNVGLTGWLENPINLRWALTQGFEISTGALTYVFQGLTMAAASFASIWVSRQPGFLPAYMPLLAGALSDLFFMGRAHTILVVLIFFSAFFISRLLDEYGRTIRKKRYAVITVILILFVGIPFSYVSLIRSPLEGYRGKVGASALMLPYIGNLTQSWYSADGFIKTYKSFTPGVNTFFLPMVISYKLGLRGDDPRKERLFATVIDTPLMGGGYNT